MIMIYPLAGSIWSVCLKLSCTVTIFWPDETGAERTGWIGPMGRKWISCLKPEFSAGAAARTRLPGAAVVR